MIDVYAANMMCCQKHFAAVAEPNAERNVAYYATKTAVKACLWKLSKAIQRVDVWRLETLETGE